MSRFKTLNLKRWIDENRSILKPPVGNKMVFELAEDFIVMVVGGPNSRKDFHYDPFEEFFYQLEGDMILKIFDDQAGKVVEVPIKEGETFLLPPRTPHSPQRPASTIGLVVERQRKPSELDGFMWFCEKCSHKIYEEYCFIHDIVKQLPPIFDRFYGNKEHLTCKKCGNTMVPPKKIG